MDPLSSRLRQALLQVDYVGSVIFIPSIIAVLFGLVLGGNAYPWGLYHIIVPLVLGFLGWVVFHLYESSRFCHQPSVPVRLFQKRTSSAGYAMTFVLFQAIQAAGYFLPIYFQAIHGASPVRAGVPVFAILSGITMSRTGLYRPLQWCGFAILTVGLGMFSILDANSSLATQIGLQFFPSFGAGVALPTILPAILASLQEADVALATGVYSFVRCFAFVWGASLPLIVLINEFQRNEDKNPRRAGACCPAGRRCLWSCQRGLYWVVKPDDAARGHWRLH